MDTFRTKVIKHLEWYNKNRLGNDKAGEYYYGGKVIEMHHILPRSIADKNIIAPYDSDMAVSAYLKNMKRHRYFHHLNSSQAMCINFFYPLIKEKQLDSVLRILGIEGQVNYSTVQFEKESEVEGKNDRKTSFDFYFETNEKVKAFFEIKYTEDAFGKAKSDTDHHNKFARTYESALNKCEAIAEDFKSQEKFFSNYQIMRNLINISENSYVVFLYPEENEVILKAAQNAGKNMLKPDWSRHFIAYTWEQMIKSVISYMETEELKQYYKKDFYEKYLDI
jgi:hypothetical protein